jgi:S1-C subfamily serine protease
MKALMAVLLAVAAAACSMPQFRSADDSGRSVAPRRALSTVEIVHKIRPAVVRLQAEGASSLPNRTLSPPGFGTGVICDASGYIVTCNHVLTPTSEEAPAVRGALATLWDGRVCEARIIGADPRLDLALLKIEAGTLVPAEFGDTEQLEVGDDVVAIGFALDLKGDPTVTRGVISALKRRILDQPVLVPEAIQTDAGIHPGNSGGPLLNRYGQVIGLNSAIVSGVANIGFAISAAIVKPTIETLRRHGKVERAYLGVTSGDTWDGIRPQLLSGEVPRGVFVMQLAQDSPALRAGLQAGDVIEKIDGEELARGADLLAVLARKQPGDELELRVLRNGERKSIRVRLGRYPG